MSLFVEVQSVEKGVSVIINLDHIVEIAPLRDGGCALFFNDGAAVNGIRSMKVQDNYNQFKQFAMETVSSDMIADRIAKLSAPYEVPAKTAAKKSTKVSAAADTPLEIPKL
jgi:hypothetical protein